MKDLLNRLQTVKMLLTSVLLIVAGIGFIAISQQVETWPLWRWLQLAPYGEVGGILIGAGLMSIWLDQIFRRDQETSDELRLRQVLHDEAPAIRDAVLDAFAADDEDLERVATPETLDQIISNSLALRLGDKQFAREVFTDIRDQAINSTERWHNAHLDINLAPLPHEPGAARTFEVTVRWEYTTTPEHAERRFVCLSNRDEYAELARSQDDTSAWFLPDTHLDAADRNNFELLSFTVDGDERTIRRTHRKNSQTYVARIGADTVEAQEPVTISYTYRTVTPEPGHLLFFEIEQPTRDLRVTFDYTNCELAAVSTLDMTPSVRPTRIDHAPDQVDPQITTIEIDGWIFPRSGVAFVWTATSESAKFERPPKRD